MVCSTCGKVRFLHLGWTNTSSRINWECDWLGSCSDWKLKPGGPGGWSAEQESVVHSDSTLSYSKRSMAARLRDMIISLSQFLLNHISITESSFASPAPGQNGHQQTGARLGEGKQAEQGGSTCPVKRGWGTRTWERERERETQQLPDHIMVMEKMEPSSSQQCMVGGERA